MASYEFTDRVRKALAMAREEALRHRHDYVGTEHMLLGLLRAEDPQVERVVSEAGTSAGAVRELVESRVSPGSTDVAATSLPYTSAAKRVLELSMKAARRRRVRRIEGLELLIGLVSEGRGIAATALREVGITPESVVAEGEPASEPLVVLDDRSDRSIYEQIVAQIQEHVAVGRLGPGERLPTVRRLADRLDIAPGTVARAYAELERLGLVVTQGARGTRVAPRERSAVPDAERSETLVGLLRPVAVAAFHLGATAGELRAALETAMAGIFPPR